MKGTFIRLLFIKKLFCANVSSPDFEYRLFICLGLRNSFRIACDKSVRCDLTGGHLWEPREPELLKLVLEIQIRACWPLSYNGESGHGGKWLVFYIFYIISVPIISPTSVWTVFKHPPDSDYSVTLITGFRRSLSDYFSKPVRRINFKARAVIWDASLHYKLTPTESKKQ